MKIKLASLLCSLNFACRCGTEGYSELKWDTITRGRGNRILKWKRKPNADSINIGLAKKNILAQSHFLRIAGIPSHYCQKTSLPLYGPIVLNVTEIHGRVTKPRRSQRKDDTADRVRSTQHCGSPYFELCSASLVIDDISHQLFLPGSKLKLMRPGMCRF